MTRQKIFISIPLAIAAGLLIYSWTIFLLTEALASWRHYVGLVLFFVLTLFYFKSYKFTIVGTGIYFLLATFNMLSMTAEITTSWLSIGPVRTPPIQLLSFGLFILFAVLNLDPLIEIYLDYMDSKQAIKK